MKATLCGLALLLHAALLVGTDNPDDLDRRCHPPPSKSNKVQRTPRIDLRITGFKVRSIPTGYRSGEIQETRALVVFATVTNMDEFPRTLFEPAEDFPPCEDLEIAARSWFTVCNGDHRVIVTACAPVMPGEYRELALWFEHMDDLPTMIYAEIWDRKEDVVYSSDYVAVQSTNEPSESKPPAPATRP